MICGHPVDVHFYKEIQGKFTKSLKIIIIVREKNGSWIPSLQRCYVVNKLCVNKLLFWTLLNRLHKLTVE